MLLLNRNRRIFVALASGAVVSYEKVAGRVNNSAFCEEEMNESLRTMYRLRNVLDRTGAGMMKIQLKKDALKLMRNAKKSKASTKGVMGVETGDQLDGSLKVYRYVSVLSLKDIISFILQP